jgi:hypothetical protein
VSQLQGRASSGGRSLVRASDRLEPCIELAIGRGSHYGASDTAGDEYRAQKREAKDHETPRQEPDRDGSEQGEYRETGQNEELVGVFERRLTDFEQDSGPEGTVLRA